MDLDIDVIKGVKIVDDSVENFINTASDAFNNFATQKDVDPSSLNSYKLLLFKILKGIKEFSKSSVDFGGREQLVNLHDSIWKKLLQFYNEKSDEVRIAAFEISLDVLPSEIVMTKNNMFPHYYFGSIMKTLISSHADLSVFLPKLKAILDHRDVSRNIWKALEISCCKMSENLTPKEVSNALLIINCVNKPKSKSKSEDAAEENEGPLPLFCPGSGGSNGKDIAKSVKMIWDKMLFVKLPPKLEHKLMLTLYERLMPRMNKPIFLTDYFMTSLEIGGPVSLLALQGIFNLIQKYNMNYPDVYTKIYTMLDSNICASQYKARFYYLIDMFLSSTHLPEALTAGFVKKFARLSLSAPPADIIIMLAFIVNLMIRHPSLKKLIHNPAELTYNSDPYDINEKDPSLSRAIESSLWEVQILQSHVLPSVSSAARFINDSLPTVERDLSALLETTTEEIFMKESKKKMKNIPVAFEKPSSLLIPNTKSGFSLWSFKS